MPTTRELPAVSPTVSRIISVLTKRIQSGDYREGEWLPSERALADEFNVSRILIRAAVKELERQTLVSCAAYRRPLVRSRFPVAPPEAGTPSIALWIWPGYGWPGSAMMIHGVQEALGERYRLVLGNTTGNGNEPMVAAEARFLRRVCQDRDIRGIILSFMGTEINRSYLEPLRASGIPLVFLDHNPPSGFDADYVGVNNKRGAEQAVRHLLSLGHTRIGHVSNDAPFSTVAERHAGYRRALERAGIPYRPEFVVRDPGPSDPEKGCGEVIARLLDQPEPPTALFAVNDITAYRTIYALRERGLRVPEDVSVVGFDGIERWMPAAPFLTTMYQPFDEIGAQAVELLTERIERGPETPYRHVIMDVPLVIQNSTRRR
jgi:DNA-binding LacI/PurR family transcriptional regulator